MGNFTNSKYDRNIFREKHIENYISIFSSNYTKELKNATILDIGCGLGILTINLAPYVKKIIGVDIDPQLIQKAKKYQEEKNIKNVSFIVSSIFDWKDDKKYDIILLSDVLEHVKEQKKLLQVALSYLKNDGILYFNTPNKWFPIEAHTGRLFLGYLSPKFADKCSTLLYKKRFNNYYLIGYFKLMLLLKSFPIHYVFISFPNPTRELYRIGKPFVDKFSILWCFSNAFQIIIKIKNKEKTK